MTKYMQMDGIFMSLNKYQHANPCHRDLYTSAD